MKNENAKVVRFYFDNGYRVGILVRAGDTWLHVILMDTPIHFVRVPAEEEVGFEFLPNTPAAAAAHFLGAGLRLGITPRAQRVCEAIAHGVD